MLLMSDSRAAREGRPVLAEIAGWGLTSDAHHITGPARDGSGLALALQKALASAEMRAEEVGSISAHGTGTVYNDSMEMKAFKSVFPGAAASDVFREGRNRSYDGNRRPGGRHRSDQDVAGGACSADSEPAGSGRRGRGLGLPGSASLRQRRDRFHEFRIRRHQLRAGAEKTGIERARPLMNVIAGIGWITQTEYGCVTKQLRRSYSDLASLRSELQEGLGALVSGEGLRQV